MTGPGDKLRNFMSRFIRPKKNRGMSFEEAQSLYENKPRQELSVSDAKAISNFSNQIGNKSLAEQVYDEKKKKKKQKENKRLDINITKD